MMDALTELLHWHIKALELAERECAAWRAWYNRQWDPGRQMSTQKARNDARAKRDAWLKENPRP
jgi:hypothetical protein